jgi:flavin reductase (DIM6/NTAB) family NADH-FMN oxidoreductase RutF
VPRPEGVSGSIPQGHDPDTYDRLRRRVLWSMPTGLFVIGSRSGERWNLMTANLVMQVATTPKLVAVAVEVGAVTRQLIMDGGGFSVSILARSDRAVARCFVRPTVDVVVDAETGTVVSMQGEPVNVVSGGLPVLSTSVGWLSCEVRSTLEANAGMSGPGSHTLFVGEVVEAFEREDDGVSAETREILRMEDTRMSYGG